MLLAIWHLAFSQKGCDFQIEHMHVKSYVLNTSSKLKSNRLWVGRAGREGTVIMDSVVFVYGIQKEHVLKQLRASKGLSALSCSVFVHLHDIFSKPT